MNVDETLDLMTLMATIWPNFHAHESAETVAVWQSILADVPASDALEAVKRFAVEGERFAPVVAELRLAARTLGAVPVERAWTEVADKLRAGWLHPQGDPVDPGDFTDPLIYQAAITVRRELREEGATWARKAFEREYERLLRDVAEGRASRAVPAVSGPAPVGELPERTDRAGDVRALRARLDEAAGPAGGDPYGGAAPASNVEADADGGRVARLDERRARTRGEHPAGTGRDLGAVLGQIGKRVDQ